MADQNEFDAFLRLEIANLDSVVKDLETELAKAPDKLNGRMKAVLSAAKEDAKNLAKNLSVAKTIPEYEKIRKGVLATSVAAQEVRKNLARAPGGVFDNKKLKETEKRLSMIAIKTADISKKAQRTSLSSLNVLRVVQDAQFGIFGVANNLQELSLSFTQLLRTEGSLSAALSKTLKPLIAGPFAIPLLITLGTLLAQNWDKLVSKAQDLRVAIGDLSRTNKVYLDQLKELNKGELFQGALGKLLGDVKDIEALRSAMNATGQEIERVEEQIRNATDSRVVDALKQKVKELQGTFAGFLKEITERQELARAKGFLGALGIDIPDDEKKKVKDLDEAFMSLIATLERRGLKEQGFEGRLEAINREFEEITRKIRKDFAKRPDLIAPLLAAAAEAQARLIANATEQQLDFLAKEAARKAREALKTAVNEIRRGAQADIGQLQSLITGLMSTSIDRFDFDGLNDRFRDVDALQQEIFERQRDALLEERKLKQDNVDEVARIDAQLIQLDNARTMQEANNAKQRAAIRQQEVDGMHQGVQSIIGSTSSLFTSLATITAQEGAKGFEQNKALLKGAATAEAIAAGISAVRVSLNSGLGPFAIPAAIAAGTAVTAKLFAQIKQIDRAGKGGGGLTTFSGGFVQLNSSVNNERINNLAGFQSRRLGQNAIAENSRVADQTASQIVGALNTLEVTIDQPTMAKVTREGNEFNRKRIKTT